jgi:hypothetical protein
LNEYKKTESILTEQYEMKTWNQWKWNNSKWWEKLDFKVKQSNLQYWKKISNEEKKRS